MLVLAVPLLVWLVSLTTVSLAAHAAGVSPLAAATWERWDSAHYLSIASHGYALFPCPDGSGWCGNAAWFPGYPWTIEVVHSVTRLPFGWAGVTVAWTAALVCDVVVWRSTAELAFPVRVGALAFMCVAPGLVYFFSVFPLSMFVAFTLLFLTQLHRSNWLYAGLAGFAAFLCYPIGLVIPFIAAIWCAVRRSSARAVLTSTLLPLSALPVILAVQRVETGSWRAFFDVQHRYGHGFHDPVGVTWNAILPIARADNPFSLILVTSWQTMLVTFLLALIGVGLVVWRRRLGHLELLVALWLAAAWAFPLTQANVSIWRSQAALAPMAVLVARLPWFLVVGALAGEGVIAFAMARLFFEGRLI